jgi:hypothetical protein
MWLTLILAGLAAFVVWHHGQVHRRAPWSRRWFDAHDLWHLVHSHEGLVVLLLLGAAWARTGGM